jgi:predicted ester cyclase
MMLGDSRAREMPRAPAQAFAAVFAAGWETATTDSQPTFDTSAYIVHDGNVVTNEYAVTEEGPMTTIATSRARTVAHDFVDLMNGHDPDAVDGFIAEAYINHNAFVDDGREANRAFWAQWFTAFPDTQVTLDDVLVDGDRVAGRFTYSGTFTGPFLGLEPTGVPVVMHSIDIWRVEGGMAVEHWDQIDSQAFFAQLTADPAPASTLDSR